MRSITNTEDIYHKYHILCYIYLIGDNANLSSSQNPLIYKLH